MRRDVQISNLLRNEEVSGSIPLSSTRHASPSKGCLLPARSAIAARGKDVRGSFLLDWLHHGPYPQWRAVSFHKAVHEARRAWSGQFVRRQDALSGNSARQLAEAPRNITHAPLSPDNKHEAHDDHRQGFPSSKFPATVSPSSAGRSQHHSPVSGAGANHPS